MSQLGRCATGDRCAYLDLTVSGSSARDCTALHPYPHLQRVTLTDGQLTSLAGLESMPYLAYLDVSSNQLETFLDLPVSPIIMFFLCCVMSLSRTITLSLNLATFSSTPMSICFILSRQAYCQDDLLGYPASM